MTLDRMVLAFAGSFILMSLLVSVVHSHNWLWFTAFAGANLLQSAFTGFFPFGDRPPEILSKAGSGLRLGRLGK